MNICFDVRNSASSAFLGAAMLMAISAFAETTPQLNKSPGMMGEALLMLKTPVLRASQNLYYVIYPNNHQKLVDISSLESRVKHGDSPLMMVKDVSTFQIIQQPSSNSSLDHNEYYF
ncbi:hypothetical protein NBRC116494_24750 [Aurantivibrio plasticivorans]